MTTALSAAKPMRILHVLGAFGHGGIEIWLMNMLRAIDRSRFQFDFAVDSPDPGPFDEEVRQLGGRIIPYVPPQRNPWAFRRRMTALLRHNGPYDIVHSHVHFMSGSILKVAASCGIPRRIAHSHADFRREHAAELLPRKLLTHWMTAWVHKYATEGLAISEMAAQSLFGPNWRADPRWSILWYGFDFSQFAELPDRHELRRQLGLPENRVIIGQVGRLVEQKNYPLSILVVKELLQAGLDVHFLVVGCGHLENSIRGQLEAAGLSGRTTMVGDQHSVAPFYGAMDCLLFPSLFEGLGIVALEAQAAGVPIVASEFVPPEADVIPGMMEYVSLTASPGRWAEAVRRQLAQPLRSPREAAAQMAQSEYAIQQSMQKLCAIYSGQQPESASGIPDVLPADNKLRTVKS
jgi:glycosyltransferase involved in cell wall biosynthesis